MQLTSVNEAGFGSVNYRDNSFDGRRDMSDCVIYFDSRLTPRGVRAVANALKNFDRAVAHHYNDVSGELAVTISLSDHSSGKKHGLVHKTAEDILRAVRSEMRKTDSAVAVSTTSKRRGKKAYVQDPRRVRSRS